MQIKLKMKSKNLGLNTICTHVGEVEDKQFKGAVSPIYMATSYAYDNVDVKRYPRYFYTPNQEMLSKKIAALEGTEAAMIFGSGMRQAGIGDGEDLTAGAIVLAAAGAGGKMKNDEEEEKNEEHEMMRTLAQGMHQP